MVMGGDSCSEGRGFKTQHCLPDGHFSHIICCKNCNVCLERQKLMKKWPGMVHLKNPY